MRFFDLSFRHKIPLWGSALIVSSAVAVSGALMFRAYEDLKHDLIVSSQSLGYTLAKTLFPTLLHDDPWRAFELVRAPFHEDRPKQPLDATAIFVVNPDMKVLVSSMPRTLPLLSDLGSLDDDLGRLATALRNADQNATNTFEFPDSDQLYVTIPVAEEGERLGTLVITHSKDVFLPRFFGIALGGAGMGALVLAVLLPLNWYWGRRMAIPLTNLAAKLSEMRHRLPVDDELRAYVYNDELGRLFDAYGTLLEELKEADRMKDEFVKGQRLAAIGRLAASIAHEINNPLAGMLTAIDTLKQRGALDPRDARTVGLLERSLTQIKDTVKALLVEAKSNDRSLTAGDVEDVRTLLHAQITKKAVNLEWRNEIERELPLSANLVRQVLINILINAVQATELDGHITLLVRPTADVLMMEVTNDGARLLPEMREHLFEPFTTSRESGHGLGLWVTYQIVQQLGGTIRAEDDGAFVKFTVELPLRSQWKTNIESA